MSELLDHVEQTIHARGLFRPRQRVLVAVSGGVDSLVLLHLLHELARTHRWRLTVAHLNHCLRGRSSDADERLVCRAAARLKLPVVTARADVRRLARAQKLSLEMAAREARHDFLASTAARLRIPTVALAQHADDQLELFFLRLLRGSGGEGLAGMKWQSPSPSDRAIALVRPLLDQPKRVLCQFAAERGIRHREDASNALLDFQRNRIRHELLPLLRRKYQPGLDKTIARVMAIVGTEAEFAGQTAKDWLRGRERFQSREPKTVEARASSHRLLREKEGGLERLQFGELPMAVQRRCVQLQLAKLGIASDFELVEELRMKAGRKVAVSLAQVSQARAATDGGSCFVVRDRCGLVRLQAAAAEALGSEARQVDLHGKATEQEFAGVRIAWRVSRGRGDKRAGIGVRREYFDADKVGSPVVLRHWQPGDRFQPIGMAQAVKLQDFFTNRKVPREDRHRLIVAATAKGEVFWVEGMRISERFKLTPGTIRRLQWRWKRL